MKKLFLTALILMNILPAPAFENYMIISNTPVKSVAVKDPQIADVIPVFTIDNQKKILLLKSKKKGSTKIFVKYTTEEKVLEVKVTAKSTKIKPVDGFEYFVMDEPPAEIEIPAPPANPVIPPPVIKDGE